jgi:N-acetylglucosaminyldiphosphoundecaprenol N-acetyl-beta-D-mannosaminyltransferase
MLGPARVNVLTEAACVAIILEALANRRGGWVLTLNLDILRRFERDPESAKIYQQADLVVADGAPILWACRILGFPLPERIAGASLIWRLSAAAAESGHAVYLLGGDPGTADKAASVWQRRFQGLKIAGIMCPEMRFETRPDRVAGILKSVSDAHPDIVYVALGSPKQERLIRQLREVHPRAWYIGVGISFSFASGDIRRAPLWMQNIGLEWLHRLAQEPGRLLKRYILQGISFGVFLLGRSFIYRIARRHGGKDMHFKVE